MLKALRVEIDYIVNFNYVFIDLFPSYTFVKFNNYVFFEISISIIPGMNAA